MKAAALLFALVTSLALADEVRQTPVAPDHPLLGTWRIEFPNGCAEELTLRADGSKLSSSGEERNESIFELSPEPLPSGFYRFTDQITKGNGQPDCNGQPTPQGHVATTYLRLHPGFDRFVMCGAPNMKSCYAEFRRKGGNS